MAVYLFTGTDPSGTCLTERIEAPTASAARYKLELRGFKDITFHTDDMCAQFDAGLKAEFGDSFEDDSSDDFSAAYEMEARRSGGVLRLLWLAWKASKGIWLPLLLWNCIAVWAGRPYGWVDLTGFAFSTLFVLFFFWSTLPSIAYDKLLHASVWYRWNDVRRWIGFIRLLKKLTFAPIPNFELDFRAAYALAAEGKLPEALDLVKQYEEGSFGKYQYFARLASLFDAAGDYNAMLECQRQAVELGAGKPEEKLDIALTLLRRHRQVEEPAKILADIDLSNCADIVSIYHLFCSGLVGIETSDWSAAEENLRHSIQAAAPYSTNVIFAGLLQEIRAFHAIALAHLGHKTEAATLIRNAAPLLKARQEQELLDRCNEALKTFEKSLTTPPALC